VISHKFEVTESNSTNSRSLSVGKNFSHAWYGSFSQHDNEIR